MSISDRIMNIMTSTIAGIVMAALCIVMIFRSYNRHDYYYVGVGSGLLFMTLMFYMHEFVIRRTARRQRVG